jgi:hypothetical protein
MKMLAILTALLAAPAFAQVNGMAQSEVGSLTLVGSGAYVCASAVAFGGTPVLARGGSKIQAQVAAQQLCTKAVGATFCSLDKVECERDSNNGNLAEIIFDITKTEKSVDIVFKGNAKYASIVRGFGGVLYTATAPTKLEAKIVGLQICSTEEKSSNFCDVKEIQQINGVSGNVNVGGLIDLLKKRK